MRLAALIVLAAIYGCGDPGPRDRSLKLKIGKDEPVSTTPLGRPTTRKHTSTSVIGLVADPLARFYSDGASIVLRFNDFTSLMREAAPRLTEVSRALPGLKLPNGTPASLLHRILRLPNSVVFDPFRPFAFVKTEQGWAVVVATRARKEAGDRLRALDGIYCVAGDPAVVDKYEPGFRKGFYLPGDCSIIAKPGAVATLGTELTRALAPLGINLGFLDGQFTTAPEDIERVDLALRFSRNGMRCDMRLAPNRESPTALFLERMKPRPSSIVNWLPSDGTAYLEFGSGSIEWERLLLNVMRDTVRTPDPIEAPGLHALRKGLSMLGSEFAAMLDLDSDGAGRVFLIGSVEDSTAARSYLASRDFATLLNNVAGPGGRLEWMPEVFKHDGVEVGAVTGHVSRKRLAAWRNGDILQSTMSIMMRGPVVAYVAITNGKLCMVFGQHARRETERFLDAIAAGKPGGNEHSAEVDPLFRTRLVSASVDVAALFDGVREAAPLWHERGRALRSIALRWRLPIAAAVTVEGGALRLAVRFTPRMLAEAAARVVNRLATAGEKEHGK